MEPLYFIWEDLDDDEETVEVEAVVSNEYYPEFDMWIYLN
jgi:hypothetical protein